MLLSLDDPAALLVNVPDASLFDGKRVTITARDGTTIARALASAISETTLRIEEREDLLAADQFVVRDSSAVAGVAVRLRTTEARPEQDAFRRRVGEAWGWRCAVTGEAIPEVLEAAHLPGSSWRAGSNTATDGILLRVDLHRLLDAGLLQIEQGVVRVRVGSYSALDGREVRPPAVPGPPPGISPKRRRA